jgi:hypothetical protein
MTGVIFEKGRRMRFSGVLWFDQRRQISVLPLRRAGKQ